MDPNEDSDNLYPKIRTEYILDNSMDLAERFHALTNLKQL